MEQTKKAITELLMIISFRWLPRCASLLETFGDLWVPLIPECEQVAPVAVQEFFNCVAALMSLQLRSLVVNSLQDLLYFFTIHEVWIKYIVILKSFSYLLDLTFCISLLFPLGRQ